MFLILDTPPIEKNKTSLVLEKDVLLFPLTSIEYYNPEADKGLFHSIKNKAGSTSVSIELEPEFIHHSTWEDEESLIGIHFYPKVIKKVKMNLKFNSVKKHSPSPFL